MTEPLREQVLKVLETDWATYVERFQSWPSETQTAFLARQGYARLADLLAHIVAWWQDGSRAIPRIMAEPSFETPSYDVEAFNARAVAGVHDQDEAEVIALFEATRQHLSQLVSGLPFTAFENPRLADRLRMEVIGHLAEHALGE